MLKFNHNLLAYKLQIAQQLPVLEKVSDPIAQAIQQSIAVSCTIFVKSGKKEWTGSGFHLGNGYVATAGHVIPVDLKGTSVEINATFDGKNYIPMEYMVSDPNIDSGIIFNPQIPKIVPSAKLGNSNSVKIGDIIAVISSPEGWHDTATVGRISNVHQSMGQNAPSPAWNDIIFIDADILQGSSGGMVIGTDGLIYGSVMGVTGQHADLGIGERSICPSNKIQALLQTVAK